MSGITYSVVSCCGGTKKEGEKVILSDEDYLPEVRQLPSLIEREPFKKNHPQFQIDTSLTDLKIGQYYWVSLRILRVISGPMSGPHPPI